jgi:hypothetical protein
MEHFVTLIGWVLRRPFLIEYHRGAPKLLTFGSSVEGVRDRPLRQRGGAVHHPMPPLDEGRQHQAPTRDHKRSHVANLHCDSRLLDSDLREFSRESDNVEPSQIVTVK